jgi:metal-sulfur cluster biosynthetic enzyme
LAEEVEQKLKIVPGVEAVDVVVIFDPPWNADMMEESARLELGLL